MNAKCNLDANRGARFVALVLLLSSRIAQADTSPELNDAAARIEYAFFTADARALNDVLAATESLQLPQSLAAMQEYYLAYGHWKLAQTYALERSEHKQSGDSRTLGAKAAQGCERHAQAAAKQDPRLAEAYAIDAVCNGLGQTLGLLSTSKATLSCARHKSLRTALELEPTNPRVQFIAALCENSASADAASPAKFRIVVEAFAAAPPSRPGKPDWGEAEALTVLGGRYLEQGDPLAARDALERALVLAPDYRRAQELLQTAAARPH